ncbi:MAG: hypothetical protein HQL52_11890 [Magnetococcales bacterium]|nr:hypothetical protein [Magnetococcales bacterium]
MSKKLHPQEKLHPFADVLWPIGRYEMVAGESGDRFGDMKWWQVDQEIDWRGLKKIKQDLGAAPQTRWIWKIKR